MVGISVIIPALNEEKTIERVVLIAKATPLVEEVIVVDDCSSDNTVKIAKHAGAKVVTSKLLGKGASMHDGLVASTMPIIAFIDADLSNVDENVIQRLCEPIVLGNSDFVKSTFGRDAGRVTELVAKPLLEIFFPLALRFTQPLSGMIAGKRAFFEKIEFEKDYGVDIGILLDMLALSAVIEEVDIGFINHKMKSWRDLKPMSLEVSRTIVKKAAEYNELNFLNLKNIERFSNKMEFIVGQIAGSGKKIAFFDMDGVLLDGRFVFDFAKKHGFLENVENISVEDSDTFVKTKKIALLLKGFSLKQVFEVVGKIPLMPNAKLVVKALKKKGYAVGVITDSYDVVAEKIRQKLGLDFSIANRLEIRDGIVTGEVQIPSLFLQFGDGCKKHAVCKSNALKKIAIEGGVELKDTVAVGDNLADVCMVEIAGKGIAFMPKTDLLSKAAKIVINKKDLQYVLKYS